MPQETWTPWLALLKSWLMLFVNEKAVGNNLQTAANTEAEMPPGSRNRWRLGNWGYQVQMKTMVDSNLPLFVPTSFQVFPEFPFPVNLHLVQSKHLWVGDGECSILNSLPLYRLGVATCSVREPFLWGRCLQKLCWASGPDIENASSCCPFSTCLTHHRVSLAQCTWVSMNGHNGWPLTSGVPLRLVFLLGYIKL